MAILRVDIERALDELVSQENGMRFQGLAVALGKKRWPELIARQRKKDFGLGFLGVVGNLLERGRDGCGKPLPDFLWRQAGRSVGVESELLRELQREARRG